MTPLIFSSLQDGNNVIRFVGLSVTTPELEKQILMGVRKRSHSRGDERQLVFREPENQCSDGESQEVNQRYDSQLR
jgi:hypothetical protein